MKTTVSEISGNVLEITNRKNYRKNINHLKFITPRVHNYGTKCLENLLAHISIVKKNVYRNIFFV